MKTLNNAPMNKTPWHRGKIFKRTIITQIKTKKPVHFEITETRDSLLELINKNELTYHDFLFHSRLSTSEHLSTRQYALIVKNGLLLLVWIQWSMEHAPCDEQKLL